MSIAAVVTIEFLACVYAVVLFASILLLRTESFIQPYSSSRCFSPGDTPSTATTDDTMMAGRLRTFVPILSNSPGNCYFVPETGETCPQQIYTKTLATGSANAVQVEQRNVEQPACVYS